MTLPEHLGGHLNKTHLDEGSLSFFINILKIKSFLDIGCGPGGMVELANKKGLESLGIDGDYTLNRFDATKFIIHDFTQGPLLLDKTFDLCWSCEFVEHVEKDYVDNFMKTFNYANQVLITFAPPNTPGHHHVNCQTQEYWIDLFKNYNFNYNNYITKHIRKVSTMQKPFVKNNGLFFEK